MHCLYNLLAFACCVVAATAFCTTSKYNQGTKDWLRCSEVSFTDVQNKLQPNLIRITVSDSPIQELPNLGFMKNSTTLEDLNFHACGISRIGSEAFRGLLSLKKLSLPYNNITSLNVSWFFDLPSLEQLDVSFNLISAINPNIYLQLMKLQRFEINDNRLNCIPTEQLQNVRNLKTIRIHENPLTYSCRARLTLWLKDHEITYATDEDNFKWLDKILWQCYIDYPKTQVANNEEDKKMNICVITKMFNQLTTVLGVSPSIQSSTAECTAFRNSLTQCLWNKNVMNNGDVIMNLLALTKNDAKIVTP